MYLKWHLIHSMAPYLSSSFVHEDFNMQKGKLCKLSCQLVYVDVRCLVYRSYCSVLVDVVVRSTLIEVLFGRLGVVALGLDSSLIFSMFGRCVCF